MAPPRITALITGTNRLIESQPTDVRITIIVTSRTLPRAREVIDSIADFAKTTKREGIVDFDYLLVDFTDMISILSASYELNKRYAQLDYLFANSAQGVYDGIDWFGAVKEICANPIAGVTDPHYKIQRIGVKSKDNLGLVFQCNVFGPYYLIHKIKPLLKKAKARIIWVSSIMSDPKYLSFDDLQLLKTDSSYEGSKRSIDLLHIATYKKLKDEGIIQYVIQPGIFTSLSFYKFLNVFTYYGMLFLFYMTRFLGSPWMCISGYSAANAPIYAAVLANPNFEKQDVKYGSACYKDGAEYIKQQEIDPTGASDVLKYLDGLTEEWDEKLKDQITISRKP
ncbi:3-keto-steroid reductase [Wickerhamomyces ciferrii]|uniref:3beta-hydroxysteroid 3-dehydrogenase n=1 Tax=Wickerhamomyces ciferrii (strain ATCC 14091 / BCRC 22168 / CBS 111 / JCM 3599 / NBRC 0793 / NRRL Y-1031 F-60-10) TaxID=1206466 RepID=K0KJW9_WICCF|nr:3-keto-steroid reductase [Wickerhamomyces ciferrii]CCH42452.1 3-keto-steroid reductase [Wickerhamomyces ciferrii]